MKDKHVRVRIDSLEKRPIRSDPGEKEDLLSLGKSYRSHPIHPIVVHLDMTVADGHRRVAGLEPRATVTGRSPHR